VLLRAYHRVEQVARIPPRIHLRLLVPVLSVHNAALGRSDSRGGRGGKPFDLSHWVVFFNNL
jgi:hypothetical protein